METQQTHSVSVFGVRLDLADTASLWEDWDEAIARRRRITITAPHFHILLDAARNSALRAFLNTCSTNHIDGIGAWIAVRLLHGIAAPRLTGTDTMLPWLDRCFARGTRVYVLGGSPESSAQLHQRIHRESPGASFACRDGQIDLDDGTIATDIEAWSPDVLLVSLGSSFQFTWLERYRAGLGVPVVVATGGFVEFLAGTRPRAPRWMRALGVEWLHRLLHEPGRLWRRYILGIPRFLFLIIRERLRGTPPS